MKRNAKHILKAVMILTDPDPSFASLVPHGANQTPFRKLASDNEQEGGVVAKTTVPSKQEPAMDDKQETTIRQRTRTTETTQKMDETSAVAEVHKFVFSKSVYSDEPSVRKYLDEHGYASDLVIKADDETFVVDGHAEDEFSSPISIINHNGIAMHVGILAPIEAATEETAKSEEAVGGDNSEPDETPKEVSEETPQETDTSEEPQPELDLFSEDIAKAAKVASAPETIAKFDDIKQVLSFTDDVPPGFYDIVYAYTAVVRAAIADRNYPRIGRVSRELGGFVVDLARLFESTDEENVERAEKAASILNSMCVMPDAPTPILELGDEVTKSEQVDELPKVETADPAPVATKDTEEAPIVKETDEIEQPEQQTTPSDMASIVQQALADGLKPLAASVDAIKDEVATIKETAKSADERVSAIENSRQVRKSSDEASTPTKDDTPTVTTWKYDELVPQDRLLRDTIGLR